MAAAKLEAMITNLRTEIHDEAETPVFSDADLTVALNNGLQYHSQARPYKTSGTQAVTTDTRRYSLPTGTTSVVRVFHEDTTSSPPVDRDFSFTVDWHASQVIINVSYACTVTIYYTKVHTLYDIAAPTTSVSTISEADEYLIRLLARVWVERVLGQDPTKFKKFRRGDVEEDLALGQKRHLELADALLKQYHNEVKAELAWGWTQGAMTASDKMAAKVAEDFARIPLNFKSYFGDY